jgi:hypothetical protein
MDIDDVCDDVDVTDDDVAYYKMWFPDRMPTNESAQHMEVYCWKLMKLTYE